MLVEDILGDFLPRLDVGAKSGRRRLEADDRYKRDKSASLIQASSEITSHPLTSLEERHEKHTALVMGSLPCSLGNWLLRFASSYSIRCLIFVAPGMKEGATGMGLSRTRASLAMHRSPWPLVAVEGGKKPVSFEKRRTLGQRSTRRNVKLDQGCLLMSATRFSIENKPTLGP